MSSFLGPLRGPALALITALAAAALAWSWFNGSTTPAIVIALSVLLIGSSSQAYGASRLPADPEAAVRWLNAWTLVVLAATAASAAVVIVVTVALASPDQASNETKELLSAVTTAVTTFLAGIALSHDKADETVGARIQKLFYAHYGRAPGEELQGRKYVVRGDKCLMPAGSDGENAVFSEGWHELQGWGRDARRDRASILAEYLRG